MVYAFVYYEAELAAMGIFKVIHRTDGCREVNVAFSTSFQRGIDYELLVSFHEAFIRDYAHLQFTSMVLYPLTGFDMVAVFHEVNTCDSGTILTDQYIISATYHTENYPPPGCNCLQQEQVCCDCYTANRILLSS